MCLFCVPSESRRILLPVVLHHIHLHLRQQKELLICSGILSSIFSIIKTSSLVTQTHTCTHTLETPLHSNLSVIVGFERALTPEARRKTSFPAEASPGFAVLLKVNQMGPLFSHEPLLHQISRRTNVRAFARKINPWLQLHIQQINKHLLCVFMITFH